MIHQFRDKKQIEKKKKLIKNILLIFVLLILAGIGTFSYTNGFLHYIGRPFWRAERVILNNINDNSYFVRTKKSMLKENENLLRENTDLRISMIDYNLLKDENILLKESFGRVTLGSNLILSNILKKPNYSPYDTIIIDLGVKDGISVGDHIYSNVINPIGKISVVYEKTSIATLYSNPGEITEAMIEGTNTSVELVGRGGGNFEMIIPIDLPFTNGMFVYLPNIETEVVAIIKDVISSPSDPVKKLLLSSPVNVQGLKWVYVKKN